MQKQHRSVVEHAFIIFAALFICSSPLFGAKEEPRTIYRSIEEHNLKSFPPQEPEWWSTWSFTESIKRHFKMMLTPKPLNKRKNVFDIANQQAKRLKETNTNTIIDETTWHDLNFFCGQKKKDLYLGSLVDRTSTEIGKVMLYKMLTQPCDNIEELTVRQNLIHELISNQELFSCLEKALRTFHEAENIIHSFWNNDPFEGMAQKHYFEKPILKRLNSCPFALEIKNRSDQAFGLSWLVSSLLATAILPAYGLSTIADSSLPEPFNKLASQLESSSEFAPLFLFAHNEWLVNKLEKAGVLDPILSLVQNKWFRGGLAFSAAFLSGISLPNIIDWTGGKILLERYLQFKLIKVASAICALKNLEKISRTHQNFKNALPSTRSLTKLFLELPAQSPKLKKLFNLLASPTFKGKPSIWSRVGRILCTYKLIHEHKKPLEDALMALGEIDAFVSIARLYKEFERKPITYSFAEYKQGTTPSIELEDFWNPFIDPQIVATSSITLGTRGKRRNAIITGPNAGGKSTIMKAIAINLILAQTFGIAPARKLQLTPFSAITSHLNIVDDIGMGNSLFKAEAKRANRLLEKIQTLKPGEFSFCIMDEIFNGTSPEEGTAAAYSTAMHLGQLPSSIGIIATHFAKLTDLEAKTTDFTNYKVSVRKDSAGNLHFPFKLEEGKSDQHCAIDILRLEGMANAILSSAESMLG